MEQLRTCRKCGLSKPLSDMVLWKGNPTSLCRECNKEYLRQYRIDNRERLIQFDRDRYAANPEFKRSLAKKWAREHREQHNKNTLRWAKTNKEKQRASCRNWERKNKAACRAKAHRRRARLEANGGEFLPAAWEWLKELCGNRCLRCGKPESEVKLTIDHIKPIALGGPNTIDNLQPLCHSCNSGKFKKEIDYRDVENKAAGQFLQILTGTFLACALQAGNTGTSSGTPQAI